MLSHSLFFSVCIAGSYVRSSFSFLRKLNSASHSCCTSLHSYQKWIRVEEQRWRLQGGSRQSELHKSKTLLRCWSHTWQKKKKKHQEEAKLWHPKSPSLTKLLHTTLHWENRRAPMPADACSKPAWETQTNSWANKKHMVFLQLSLG
jgi:hypothetical protein